RQVGVDDLADLLEFANLARRRGAVAADEFESDALAARPGAFPHLAEAAAAAELAELVAGTGLKPGRQRRRHDAGGAHRAQPLGQSDDSRAHVESFLPMKDSSCIEKGRPRAEKRRRAKRERHEPA